MKVGPLLSPLTMVYYVKEEPGIAPGLGDGFVINTTIMRELGYTVMKRDENGKELREIELGKNKGCGFPRKSYLY